MYFSTLRTSLAANRLSSLIESCYIAGWHQTDQVWTVCRLLSPSIHSGRKYHANVLQLFIGRKLHPASVNTRLTSSSFTWKKVDPESVRVVLAWLAIRFFHHGYAYSFICPSQLVLSLSFFLSLSLAPFCITFFFVLSSLPCSPPFSCILPFPSYPCPFTSFIPFLSLTWLASSLLLFFYILSSFPSVLLFSSSLPLPPCSPPSCLLVKGSQQRGSRAAC